MRTFKPTIGLTIVCSIAMLVLLLLGVWQGLRYREKVRLVAHIKQATTAKPILLSATTVNQLKAFEAVRVVGRFVAPVLLVSHQYYKRRLGFDVWGVLKVNGLQRYLIVNRGWVAANSDLVPAKKIPLSQKTQTLVGYMRTPAKALVLGDNIRQQGSVLYLQKIAISELQTTLKKPLLPWVLQLTFAQPDLLMRESSLVRISAERHLGYMAQWFLLALAILVIYVLLSYQRAGDKDVG